MRPFLLATWTLLLREVRHFYRDRARLTGVLLQPLLFWLLIGTGLNASFRPPGYDASYLDYFFPGVLLMVVLFTAIFSTFSIIEDRRAGFLQGVLVSPAPRSAIVLGKVLGGALLGSLQCLLFLLVPWLGLLHLQLGLLGSIELLAWLTLAGVLLTTLGFAMAWAMTSTQGYHMLMSVLLLPMWVFSGAAFPMAGAPLWLRLIMQLNPLTHVLHFIRGSFSGPTMPDATAQPWLSALYVIGLTLAGLAFATRQVRRT
jgi:ABC-2 type transport system permease protein